MGKGTHYFDTNKKNVEIFVSAARATPYYKVTAVVMDLEPFAVVQPFSLQAINTKFTVFSTGYQQKLLKSFWPLFFFLTVKQADILLNLRSILKKMPTRRIV